MQNTLYCSKIEKIIFDNNGVIIGILECIQNADENATRNDYEYVNGRYVVKPHPKFPKTLKTLRVNVLSKNSNDLPHGLEELIVVKNIDASYVNNLPKSLLKLILPQSYNAPIDNLPHGLTHLSVGMHFYQPLKNLPTTITHLALNCENNHDLQHFPNSITHLSINNTKQKCINVPESVRYLFVNSFTLEYEYIIPEFLEMLVINFGFSGLSWELRYSTCDTNRSIDITKFPKTLKYILLPSHLQADDKMNQFSDEYDYVKLSNKQWKNISEKLDFSIILNHKPHNEYILQTIFHL